MNRVAKWLAPVLLIVVGSVQMIGNLLRLPVIEAVGAAIAASPAPKVFTAQNGFETYSSYFYLRWMDHADTAHELKLTPQVYRRVRGPYNRRNAYGAALSYAPVLYASPLTRPMHEAAMNYVFCGASTILEEIGIDRASVAGPISFELRPRQKLPADHAWKLKYDITCDAK